MTHDTDKVLAEVDNAADELVAFAAGLVRIPSVNPPGDAYEECAHVIGERLDRFGFAVSYHVAEGRPEHTARHPRVNVVGVRSGARARPCVHLNGHFDVVPAGDGWTVDPFGGTVEGGRLYGRGSADMKAGLAAAMFAAEAVRRAGVPVDGTIEVSGTVDEESGGYAGVGWLAEEALLSSGRTDYVIIPEPFGPERICVGHRGVCWFEITTLWRTGHGSMPFLGANAIEPMAAVVDAMRREIGPALAERRTTMPVVPDGARVATLNLNAIQGGQAGEAVQTPCVAERCTAVFDRRVLIEEEFDQVKAEIVDLVDRTLAAFPGRRHVLRDLMVVPPVQTASDAAVVGALGDGIRQILGREPQLVASPGTYDHKHVARVAGIEQCVAYGPGVLELAHQPDEWCSIGDLINATKVLALTILRLVGQG